MKILDYRIEEHTTTYGNGQQDVVFKVKFLKKGIFRDSWEYITEYRSRTECQEDRLFARVEDAVHAISRHRAANCEPKVEIRELDETGEEVKMKRLGISADIFS